MNLSRRSLLCFFFAFTFLPSFAKEEKKKNIATHSDLLVATIDGQELRLNLFIPKDVENPPLVIYIHGGGWKNGSYQKNLVPWIPEHGFALASIGYRLTDVATFPAQIHDVKAAVRWLRANAEEYGYDATRIGVCGTSAGGHLAMLIGMSGGVAELEGEVGEHLDEDSRVQAIVNYYGPSDFVLRSRTQPAKTEEPDGSAFLLLSGKASEQPDKTKLASPAWQVSMDDPPLLILHGKRIPPFCSIRRNEFAMPINQLGWNTNIIPSRMENMAEPHSSPNPNGSWLPTFLPSIYNHEDDL